MTIEEAIKNREEHLKYLEECGSTVALEDIEAVRWSLTALRQYAEKPPCYQEEKDNPYPLCTGRGFANCAQHFYILFVVAYQNNRFSFIP